MDLSEKQKHLVQHLKNSISMSNFAVLCFLLLGFLYFFIWSPSISNPFYSLSLHQNINCPHYNSSLKTFKFPIDELELALEEASTANKTVIIAVVNRAYVEQGVNEQTTMLDLFLESLWLGEDTRPLLDHLLLVAVDQTAYDRCRFKRLHCYRLLTEGVDFGREKVYMSEDFVKMMWRRTLFLLEVLKRGYSFIFTDMDVMWLRNPFSMLNKDDNVTNYDLQISVDAFNGDPRSEDNLINTGFYYVRSNNKTVSLFDAWYAQKDNSTGKKEQDVLLELMRAGLFGQLDLRVRFLDTRYFSGFCEDSKDVRAVTTVHANCCRHISAKLRDLATVLRDWKKFKVVVEKYGRVARNRTWNFQWSRHIGCWNSWKINNTSNITDKLN